MKLFRGSKISKDEVIKQEIDYRNGGLGFVQWCEDYVWIKIYLRGVAVWCPIGDLPKESNAETGRSSWSMWQYQKDIALECLKMNPETKRFVYRLICLCWMRGEGKSLFVCLIQLWKFFNFPSQQIMLGANSKDQVKFVHFDIMRDIIINSPLLLRIVGRRNLQEKEIRLKDSKSNIVSVIRSISSFSGIVSNITGYTFSEIFDMKNPKFFTQLDGSIRNIPNAMGVIDSTVSSKEHLLYGLYDSFRKGLDPSLYFSHRESRRGDYRDFTNPEMTQQQLDSYRAKFPEREYAMYFRNTWDAGSQKMFSEAIVNCSRFIGVGRSLGEFNSVLRILEKYYTLKEENKGYISDDCPEVLATRDLIPLNEGFGLRANSLFRIGLDELEKLSNVFDTNFALCVGVDRADPMKADITAGARSIVTLIAKGLPGSRSNPSIALNQDTSVQRYMYFVLDIRHITHNDLDSIKTCIEGWYNEYDGIDSLCTERWGMWDVGDWCEEMSIYFEAVTGSYTVQREGFGELFVLLTSGRLKIPKFAVMGVRHDDIIEEELLVFDHDPDKKFYGSPEKKERNGIQDDSVYSLSWGIYGGRFLTVDDFRMRKGQMSLGMFYADKQKLVGAY